MLPQGRVLYVSNTHPLATDDNDGTDPRYPLETIQGAVDKVQEHDTILVIPAPTSRRLRLPHRSRT